MKYQVKTFRDAGLEAKWTKTRKGTPFIKLRKPNQKRWILCDKHMFETMQKDGVMEGYESHTVLADIFSIAV